MYQQQIQMMRQLSRARQLQYVPTADTNDEAVTTCFTAARCTNSWYKWSGCYHVLDSCRMYQQLEQMMRPLPRAWQLPDVPTADPSSQAYKALVSNYSCQLRETSFSKQLMTMWLKKSYWPCEWRTDTGHVNKLACTVNEEQLQDMWMKNSYWPCKWRTATCHVNEEQLQAMWMKNNYTGHVNEEQLLAMWMKNNYRPCEWKNTSGHVTEEQLLSHVDAKFFSI
jgi:hypothetical protein